MNCARIVAKMLVLTCLGLVSQAQATLLVGCDIDGMLYDIDPLTGLASNPRDTGIVNLGGIAFSKDGTLYGLNTSPLIPGVQTRSLFRIDWTTGASTWVGELSELTIGEGDLAFDPTTGLLYGAVAIAIGMVDVFFLIDPETGTSTSVGELPGMPNPCGIAFDESGTFYVLDTYNQLLWTIDKATGNELGNIPLSRSLGPMGGMDFDPLTGTLYVSDANAYAGPVLHEGTRMLYTLDVSTGVLTEIGHTGLDNGLTGLAFIPEPGAVTGLLIGAGAVFLKRSRHGRG